MRKKSAKIAHSIAHGHASSKHLHKFESIWITTPQQLEKHVQSVIHKPSKFRKLKNDRVMFIENKTQTVVAYDPHRRDLWSTYIHDPSVTTKKNALEYLLTRD